MTFWIPIVPAVAKTVNTTEERDSKVFPGTHMLIHVTQVEALYVEMSTDNPAHLPDPPFGLPKPPPLPPVPPYPTGQSQWRVTGPRIPVSAEVHMTPQAVNGMQQNEQILANLMEEFCGKITAAFTELGHAIYSYGLAKAKNDDGSLDIKISATGVMAGGHPVLIDPAVCMGILQVI